MDDGGDGDDGGDDDEIACEQHAWRDAIPVYKEKGVYNFYVKSKRVARVTRGTNSKDICPQEEAAPSSGGSGQGRSL